MTFTITLNYADGNLKTVNEVLNLGDKWGYPMMVFFSADCVSLNPFCPS